MCFHLNRNNNHAHASTAPCRDQTHAHTPHHTAVLFCFLVRSESPWWAAWHVVAEVENSQHLFTRLPQKQRISFFLFFSLSFSFVVIGGLTQRHNNGSFRRVWVFACVQTQCGSVRGRLGGSQLQRLSTSGWTCLAFSTGRRNYGTFNDFISVLGVRFDTTASWLSSEINRVFFLLWAGGAPIKWLILPFFIGFKHQHSSRLSTTLWYGWGCFRALFACCAVPLVADTSGFPAGIVPSCDSNQHSTSFSPPPPHEGLSSVTSA